MSEYRTVAFISMTIFLYWFVMAPLGGAQYFLEDDVGITEEDLKVTPSLPQYQFNPIDIQNPDVQHNIVTNDIGVTIDNATQGPGWAVYQNVPNGSVVNTHVNDTGFFSSTGIFLGGLNSPFELDGQESYGFDGNTLNVSFTKDGYYLFDLSVEEPEPNFLDIGIAYISSTFNYLLNFVKLTAELPYYVSIPLLMMVAYIIAVTVSRIGNPLT